MSHLITNATFAQYRVSGVNHPRRPGGDVPPRCPRRAPWQNLPQGQNLPRYVQVVWLAKVVAPDATRSPCGRVPTEVAPETQASSVCMMAFAGNDVAFACLANARRTVATNVAAGMISEDPR